MPVGAQTSFIQKNRATLNSNPQNSNDQNFKHSKKKDDSECKPQETGSQGLTSQLPYHNISYYLIHWCGIIS